MANLLLVSVDKTEAHIDLTDSDMAAAAEQLMQLSGDEEDDSNNNDGQTNIMKHKRKGVHSDNAADQSKDQSHRTGECLRPKKRRYQSIIHLYMTTKPVNVVYGKKD